MVDNPVSMAAFEKLQNSSRVHDNDFTPDMFEATTAFNVKDHMTKLLLKWDYPWEGTVSDLKTGLKKSAYPTKNRLNRIACAVSHYRLWAMCAKINKPILIMEHDAIFTRRLKDYYSILDDNRYDIIGLNEPMANTRKATHFVFQVKTSQDANDIVPIRRRFFENGVCAILCAAFGDLA